MDFGFISCPNNQISGRENITILCICSNLNCCSLEPPPSRKASYAWPPGTQPVHVQDPNYVNASMNRNKHQEDKRSSTGLLQLLGNANPWESFTWTMKHICREVSLSLFPRALLLCHQVTSPASSLSGSLSQVTQPGCEAFLLYFHKQNREETTVMR